MTVVVNKKAKCSLRGVDGNAWVLMGHWSECAKKSGFTSQEIKLVGDECMSKDYEHLVMTLQEHSK